MDEVQLAVYPVIALPPFAGATNVTVIVVPLGEMVGVAGVLGIVAGTVEAEAIELDPLPSALVASTVQVYVLPLVRDDTRIGDVAPEFDPVVPPSLDVHAAV